MKTLIFFAFSFMAEIICANNCTLPNGCSIETLKYKVNLYGFEKMTYNFQFNVTKCYPHIENYQFKFIENDFMTRMKNRSKHICQIDGHIDYEYMLIQFSGQKKKRATCNS